MKKTLKFLAVIIFISSITSCKYNDDLLVNENNILNSKEKVKELGLDKTYNIKEVVYEEFIESLTFDKKGRFRGAIYKGINESIKNKEKQKKFWNRFK